MKVSNRKGIANQSVPESCVAHREVRDEALTGEPAGQPSSRESFKLVQGADVVSVTEGNTDRRVSASGCPTLRGLRTWHVGTLFAREPGDLLLGRLELFQRGPHREDEESKPMTNEQEKSDLFIVAMKLANKPGRPGAESVEPRKRTEGNTGEPHTCRTQSRESVSQRLDWVRGAARGASSFITRGRSPVRELRPPGSVRGVPSNGHPYRDRNWNGSERSKLAAFHAPILAPDVITREIDVFPAEG